MTDPCRKCGQVHTKCAAHSKRNDGQPCQRDPMRGGTVCWVHGGAAAQTRQAAQRRLNEEQASRELALAYADTPVPPMDNPLRALSELAGEVVAWKDSLRDQLAILDTWRYEGSGSKGEQLNATIALFERAMDRSAALLTGIARLNIDERLARIDEQVAERITAVMMATVLEMGLSLQQQENARELLMSKIVEVDALPPGRALVAMPPTASRDRLLQRAAQLDALARSRQERAHSAAEALRDLREAPGPSTATKRSVASETVAELQEAGLASAEVLREAVGVRTQHLRSTPSPPSPAEVPPPAPVETVHPTVDDGSKAGMERIFTPVVSLGHDSSEPWGDLPF